VCLHKPVPSQLLIEYLTDGAVQHDRNRLVAAVQFRQPLCRGLLRNKCPKCPSGPGQAGLRSYRKAKKRNFREFAVMQKKVRADSHQPR
jgi:hypothetical protein